MNPTYVRSVLSRLNSATSYVANKNKDKFYPRLSNNVDSMTEDQIKHTINQMILYLQAPEFSFMMFRDYKTK